jgi:Flp pilus assembly pilin Flp
MAKVIKRLFADNSAAISVEFALVAVLLGTVIATTAFILHH